MEFLKICIKFYGVEWGGGIWRFFFTAKTLRTLIGSGFIEGGGSRYILGLFFYQSSAEGASAVGDADQVKARGESRQI